MFCCGILDLRCTWALTSDLIQPRLSHRLPQMSYFPIVRSPVMTTRMPAKPRSGLRAFPSPVRIANRRGLGERVYQRFGPNCTDASGKRIENGHGVGVRHVLTVGLPEVLLVWTLAPQTAEAKCAMSSICIMKKCIHNEPSRENTHDTSRIPMGGIWCLLTQTEIYDY